jgi:hypothetical protein
MLAVADVIVMVLSGSLLPIDHVITCPPSLHTV